MHFVYCVWHTYIYPTVVGCVQYLFVHFESVTPLFGIIKLLGMCVFHQTKSNVKSEKSAGEFNIQFVGHRKMPVLSVWHHTFTIV